ncbi:MAG: hypothetical protein Ct9H300mP23_11230 [Nitrospinota bacterium]|nr:MAG: hypothetical protein Ct9H300mP23_11230 [Nitrospinota bacterium]
MVFEVGTATMMAAKGAIKPMYEVMSEAGAKFDPDGFIGPGKKGTILLPQEKCFPCLIIHLLLFSGLIGMHLKKLDSILTWIYQPGKKLEFLFKKLKSSGNKCPLTTAWQSWVHLENLSAYQMLLLLQKKMDLQEWILNWYSTPVQIKHIQAWATGPKKGKIYLCGSRNEGGKLFELVNVPLYRIIRWLRWNKEKCKVRF